jgi:hypothetical protein
LAKVVFATDILSRRDATMAKVSMALAELVENGAHDSLEGLGTVSDNQNQRLSAVVTG